MDCPNIGEIKFSPVSLDAIENIRSKHVYANALAVAMGGGVILNIFAGNGMVEASYAIYDTDFKTLKQSMGAIPAIKRKTVENIADMAWLNTSNHKEKQFWQAVSRGCSVH